jgi:hypothetical protein
MTEPITTPMKPVPGGRWRALAAAARPDDLEYGCSAAIAVRTGEGREVARGIFPERADRGREPWNGGRRGTAAGSGHPAHAADTTDRLEHAARSLLQHRVCPETLTDQDPEEYARGSLLPATAAEVFVR